MNGKSDPPPGRRRSLRRRHLEFVLYETPSVSSEGHLSNVSEDGMFVRADELPKTGERVRIELRGSAQLLLEGDVVWTSAERALSPPGFGVRLEDPPPAFTAWVKRMRAKRAQPGPPGSGRDGAN